MIDWVPKLIYNEKDLKPWDVFVWNRDWNQYYEKRIEAVWWEKLEDTRVHNELKEEKEEEIESEESTESEENENEESVEETEEKSEEETEESEE